MTIRKFKKIIKKLYKNNLGIDPKYVKIYRDNNGNIMSDVYNPDSRIQWQLDSANNC
jgi:hypothetical protein